MSVHRQFTGASAHAETALAVSWYSVCNVPLAINPNPPNKAIPIKELDMSNVNYLPPKHCAAYCQINASKAALMVSMCFCMQ